MFTIEMLPASMGDALWIEYGEGAAINRVLIDGGTPGTRAEVERKLQGLDEPRLELLVVTHVDSDHVGGVVELLERDATGVRPHDVWFNALQHLPTGGFEELGAVQGERLSTWLEAHDEVGWNAAFKGAAVCIPDDERQPLPACELEGGLHLTVLAPGSPELAALRPAWEKELAAAGMLEGVPAAVVEPEPAGLEELGVPTPQDVRDWAAAETELDTTPANGSSICLLAEFAGRSALLLGDGHADVIAVGIERLLEQRGLQQLAVDVVKLPHHGSRRNVTAGFIGSVRSERFLVSTNGSVYHHPDREAIARTIVSSKDPVTICFNYAERIPPWDEPVYREEFGYSIDPPEDGPGLVIEV